MTATAPPSYSEAFADKAIINPEPLSSQREAPPSYNDLFPGVKDVREQVQRAREGDGGERVAGTVAICDLLCKSVFCGCCYLVLAALPIAMIVIGSIYLHDCELNSRIPIFLIVFGVFSLLQTCCGITKMILCRVKDDDDDATRKRKKGSNFGEGLVATFLFIWIIIGSVWVFNGWENWSHNDCPTTGDSQCCNPVLMYFSFVTLLVMYGIAALACCCFFCCVCCLGLLATASSD